MRTANCKSRLVGLSIALEPEQHEALAQMAQEERRSVSFLIREAVAEYVARRERRQTCPIRDGERR